LHKHSVISCAIAKGGALRERRNVRTSGGSISLVGNGIAYNNWLSATISVITAISHYFHNIRAKTAPINKAKTDHCTTVKTPNPVFISLVTEMGTSFMTVTESHFPSM